MSDAFTTLNVGAGGNAMDETSVAFPTSPTDRRRPRVQIAGDTPDAIAPVLNDDPAQNEQGLVVRPVPNIATSATESNVTVSNSSSTAVLAANPSRRLALIYNDGSLPVWIKYGTAATSSSFSLQLFPSGLLEVQIYCGAIEALANGGSSVVLRVTEM